MENNKSESQELNSFVIRYILKLYKGRDHQSLRQIGITYEEARQVSELSLADSMRLEAFNAPIANLRIAEHLSRIIEYVLQEATKDKLVDQLIRMEASQPMLMDLTGMNTKEFQQRRYELGLPKAKPGRPALLKDNEATAVHHAWHEYKTESNILQRYLYVGMAVNTALRRDLPLSQIWYHMRTQI